MSTNEETPEAAPVSHTKPEPESDSESIEGIDSDEEAWEACCESTGFSYYDCHKCGTEIPLVCPSCEWGLRGFFSDEKLIAITEILEGTKELRLVKGPKRQKIEPGDFRMYKAAGKLNGFDLVKVPVDSEGEAPVSEK